MAKYISFFNYDHQPPYCREQIQKSPTHILFQDRAPLTAGLERILISHHFHFIPIAPSPTPHKVRFDYWRNSISISYVRRKDYLERE